MTEPLKRIDPFSHLQREFVNKMNDQEQKQEQRTFQDAILDADDRNREPEPKERGTLTAEQTGYGFKLVETKTYDLIRGICGVCKRFVFYEHEHKDIVCKCPYGCDTDPNKTLEMLKWFYETFQEIGVEHGVHLSLVAKFRSKYIEFFEHIGDENGRWFYKP